MALHQHQQRYYNIAAGTGDDIPASVRYVNPVKRKVHFTDESAAVPHCCTGWETRIRQYEKDAYTSVLRAFKIQADSISWERETLITNLRHELGLSNDEHGEILRKINNENCFQGIRESYRACGDQYGVISATNRSYNIGPHGNANDPQHKQSKKHSRVPHQSLGLLSGFNQQSSLTKGRKLLKIKSHKNVGKGLSDPVQHPSSNTIISKIAELAEHNHLIGQKGLSFCFASSNENLQWIDLTKSPTGNIQLDNDDPKISTLPNYSRPSGENTSLAPVIYCEGAGRGIHIRNIGPKSDGLKVSCYGHDTSEIKIRMTDDLLRTVKRVFSGLNVDPYTIRDAKNVLKEHEKALIHVLESLADVSDDE